MASSNEENGREPFSWKRTWALAVAVGLHAFAFLLLIAPMAPHQKEQKAKEHIVQVSFIPPPPPPPPPPPRPPPPPPVVACLPCFSAQKRSYEKFLRIPFSM
jgi:protein TonB